MKRSRNFLTVRRLIHQSDSLFSGLKTKFTEASEHAPQLSNFPNVEPYIDAAYKHSEEMLDLRDQVGDLLKKMTDFVNSTTLTTADDVSGAVNRIANLGVLHFEINKYLERFTDNLEALQEELEISAGNTEHVFLERGQAEVLISSLEALGSYRSLSKAEADTLDLLKSTMAQMHLFDDERSGSFRPN